MVKNKDFTMAFKKWRGARAHRVHITGRRL